MRVPNPEQEIQTITKVTLPVNDNLGSCMKQNTLYYYRSYFDQRFKCL